MRRSRNRKLKGLMVVAAVLMAQMVQAQNVGYLGKTSDLQLGFALSNTSFRSGSFSPSLVLQYEHSVSMKNAIRIGVQSKMVKARFSDQPANLETSITAALTGSYLSDGQISFPDPIQGDFNALVNNYELAYRLYLIRTGAIAPLGTFLELGFQVHHTQLLETEATVKGELSGRDLVLRLHHVPEATNSLIYGFQCGVGDKVLIKDRRLVEWSVNFYFSQGRKPEDKLYLSHMAAAHDIVQKFDIGSSFVQLKMCYGFIY